MFHFAKNISISPTMYTAFFFLLGNIAGGKDGYKNTCPHWSVYFMQKTKAIIKDFGK